jgi:hypothetical protein
LIKHILFFFCDGEIKTISPKLLLMKSPANFDFTRRSAWLSVSFSSCLSRFIPDDLTGEVYYIPTTSSVFHQMGHPGIFRWTGWKQVCLERNFLI